MQPSFSSREEYQAFIEVEVQEKGVATENEILVYINDYWVEGVRDRKTTYSLIERCRQAGLLEKLRELEEPYRLAWQGEMEVKRQRWLASIDATKVREVLCAKLTDETQVEELIQLMSTDGALLVTNGIRMNPEAFANSYLYTSNMFDLATELKFAEIERQINQGDTF